MSCAHLPLQLHRLGPVHQSLPQRFLCQNEPIWPCSGLDYPPLWCWQWAPVTRTPERTNQRSRNISFTVSSNATLFLLLWGYRRHDFRWHLSRLQYLSVVVEVPQVQVSHSVHTSKQGRVGGWPHHVVNVIGVVFKWVQRLVVLQLGLDLKRKQ